MILTIKELKFTGPDAVRDRRVGGEKWMLYGQELSPREREVLLLKMEGHTNKTVAAALGTKEQTVKNQVSVILAKTGAPNFMALAVRYARMQDYDPDARLAALEERIARIETRLSP